MRINYVIAAWGGPRRSDDPRAERDRTFFLRTHLANLARVPHDLAAITIVAPISSAEPADFTRYLEELASTHTVIRRKTNAGFSYGSYAEAHRRLRTSFDGFIFTEDDYAFVEPNFDAKLVRMLEMQGADFVCGAVLPFREHPAVPGVAIGLCTTAAMDRWAEVQPQMPCDDVAAVCYTTAEAWQVGWGRDFAVAGLRLTDWLAEYATPYWTFLDSLRWYGEVTARPFVMPIQAFEREVPRTTPGGASLSAYLWRPISI